MIRSIQLSHEFIGKIVLLEVPSDSLLLVKRVNCILDDSDWQQLSCEWMRLPFTVSKDLQLEGFKQSQYAINAENVERRFQLSYLLDHWVIIFFSLEHFIDLRVFLSRNIESILILWVEDVENCGRIERDKIVKIYIHSLRTCFTFHCWRRFINYKN